MENKTRIVTRPVSWDHPRKNYSHIYTLTKTKGMVLFEAFTEEYDEDCNEWCLASHEVEFWVPNGYDSKQAEIFLSNVLITFIGSVGYNFMQGQSTPISYLWDHPNVEKYLKKYIKGRLIPAVKGSELDKIKNMIEVSEHYLYVMRKISELIDNLKREDMLDYFIYE